MSIAKSRKSNHLSDLSLQSQYEAPPIPKSTFPAEDELATYKNRIALLDRRIFEMRALLQSGKGLSNILEMKSLLNTFMAAVREHYGIVNSAIFLKDDLDESKEYYRVREFFGLPDSFENSDGKKETFYMFKFPKDNGLLWQIIQQGNVFSVKDLQGNPRFPISWSDWNLELLNSWTWCPLIKGGEVLGVLTLGLKRDGEQLSEKDYSFLEEFSSIASTNIDSTIKYEKNNRILNNVKTLYDINQQMSQVNDFKQLCQQTLKQAVMAINAEKGNLMLLNPENNKLELKVVWGPNIPEHDIKDINDGIIQTKSFDIGEGIAGKCAQTLKPIRINNPAELPQFGKFPAYCMCSVPVIYGDELKGVINMTNKVNITEEGDLVVDQLLRYNEEDISLLQGLADQAAQSLHKTKLYADSITDRLTGMYNKRHFDDSLESECIKANLTKTAVSLAVSDIDHFKKFNDTYGHKAGDFVLQKVAEVMSKVAKEHPGCEAFRYGGEEYCIIMPGRNPIEASKIAEQFRREVDASLFENDGQELHVTCSIGVSTFSFDSNESNKLFELADQCLYKCKEMGRNQVRIFLKGKMEKVEGEQLTINLDEFYK